ncbi:MAG: epimerase [Phycisphaerales bacterium]|nr:epimerase [Phycisphaerales bacterium]
MTNRRPVERVIIAGGSGFLGQSLAAALPASVRDVVILTRGAPKSVGRVRYVTWDAKTLGAWTAELEGADAIVNVVGRTVDCRKTPANKKVILESRVDSVNVLAAAHRQCEHPPRVWVQSATAHIYGDTGDEVLDESSLIGTGFAPDVGRAWEAALNNADLIDCRRVILRISFVLGRNGGPLKMLSRLARVGLGGTIGNGRHYMSWLHEDDLNAIILRAISDEAMSGVYIATSPGPKTNRNFMAALRRAVHRPWSPPAPAAMVRVGAFLMRTDPELALFGRRLMPTRLLREHFVFRYPSLDEALRSLLADGSSES